MHDTLEKLFSTIPTDVKYASISPTNNYHGLILGRTYHNSYRMMETVIHNDKIYAYTHIIVGEDGNYHGDGYQCWKAPHKLRPLSSMCNCST